MFRISNSFIMNCVGVLCIFGSFFYFDYMIQRNFLILSGLGCIILASVFGLHNKFEILDRYTGKKKVEEPEEIKEVNKTEEKSEVNDMQKYY